MYKLWGVMNRYRWEMYVRRNSDRRGQGQIGNKDRLGISIETAGSRSWWRRVRPVVNRLGKCCHFSLFESARLGSGLTGVSMWPDLIWNNYISGCCPLVVVPQPPPQPLPSPLHPFPLLLFSLFHIFFPLHGWLRIYSWSGRQGQVQPHRQANQRRP